VEVWRRAEDEEYHHHAAKEYHAKEYHHDHYRADKELPESPNYNQSGFQDSSQYGETSASASNSGEDEDERDYDGKRPGAPMNGLASKKRRKQSKPIRLGNDSMGEGATKEGEEGDEELTNVTLARGSPTKLLISCVQGFGGHHQIRHASHGGVVRPVFLVRKHLHLGRVIARLKAL